MSAERPTAPRRITVMADYAAFPVWGPVDDPGNPLRMSEDLRSALRAWGEAYDIHNLDDTWPADLPYDRWREQGRELAIRLRDELGPSWEVVYHDWGPADDEDGVTQELV